MQGCSGKHVFLQCHGGPGALCAWLMRELQSCPAPGWGSQAGRAAGWAKAAPCASVWGQWEGKSLSLCQRAGRGLREAQAAQPDVLQEHDPTGETTHSPALENCAAAFLLQGNSCFCM